MALRAFLFTTANVVSIPGMPGKGLLVVYGDEHRKNNHTSRIDIYESVSVCNWKREVNW